LKNLPTTEQSTYDLRVLAKAFKDREKLQVTDRSFKREREREREGDKLIGKKRQSETSFKRKREKL
jgi:hypothetical protein